MVMFVCFFFRPPSGVNGDFSQISASPAAAVGTMNRVSSASLQSSYSACTVSKVAAQYHKNCYQFSTCISATSDQCVVIVLTYHIFITRLPQSDASDLWMRCVSTRLLIALPNILQLFFVHISNNPTQFRLFEFCGVCPLMVHIFAIIQLSDRGPVFYHQSINVDSGEPYDEG